MSDGQNFGSGKRKYLYGSLLLMFISVICVAFSLSGRDDFDTARREILLRRIGHEILLQSGDSTSRVLTVKRIAENEYQIGFENVFRFQPDLLVSTTQRLLARDPLARDYVVNVVNCANGSVAYGYAISQNRKDDIVACLGRIQPKACYTINLKFKTTGTTIAKTEYVFGALLLLALGGFVFWRSVKHRKAGHDLNAVSDLRESPKADAFSLGSMSFDAEHRTLTTNEKTIDLTNTEDRVLRIFAMLPNEVIERSRLQKEIWEDEGVIVGRSLDMFISKLRKKLESDPNIKIVVIRGKGYKLEVVS